jgi:AcrR family transcriptional regulator
MTTAPLTLKPRKTPIQARSSATIDALHTATIQVLVHEGLSRCTTTRVAMRAGMSVGSLYQYYPNRDALLAAVLEHHLEGVAAAVEDVTVRCRGKPIAQMAFTLVRAFLAVKLRDPEESKALYAVSGERGGPELAARMQARMDHAIAQMLSSAPDAVFQDPMLTATVARSALFGPVRAVLDGHGPPALAEQLEQQLVRLLTAYLQS